MTICNNNIKNFLSKKTPFAAIFLLIAILYHCAYFDAPLNRDSGVFLYAGSEIVSGNTPYKDVWDHKGPLIYFLNALGVLLTPASPYGTLLLEVVLTTFSFCILYALLRCYIAPAFPLLSVIIAISAYFQLHSFGNFEENFAIAGQSLSAFALINYFDKKKSLYCFIIGLAASWCALLRPNLAGMPLVFFAAVLVFPFKQPFSLFLKKLFLFFIGVIALLLPLAVYFIYMGALSYAIDQSILYNLILSDISLFDRLKAGAALLSFMTEIGLLPFIFIGLAALLMIIINSGSHVLPEILSGFQAKEKAFIAASIVAALVIEMLLNTLSLYHWAHYVIALIAVSTILAGITLETVASKLLNKNHLILSKTSLSVLMLIVPAVLIGEHHFNLLKGIKIRNYQNDLVSFIEKSTAPNDSVLIYGAAASLNFLSGRRSPTRYVYQYPLIMKGYTSPEKVNEFLMNLRKNPPSLIVDENNGRFNSLDKSRESIKRPSVEVKFQADWQSLKTVRDWIQENYVKVSSIGNTDFYRLQ